MRRIDQTDPEDALLRKRDAHRPANDREALGVVDEDHLLVRVGGVSAEQARIVERPANDPAGPKRIAGDDLRVDDDAVANRARWSGVFHSGRASPGSATMALGYPRLVEMMAEAIERTHAGTAMGVRGTPRQERWNACASVNRQAMNALACLTTATDKRERRKADRRRSAHNAV